MKIPSKNTCAYAICKTIHATGMKTSGQLASGLTDRFQRATTADKVSELVSTGVLVRVEDKLEISTPIRRYFDQCERDLLPKAEEPGTIATYRTPKPFVPLKSYKLSRDGMREGADDHRKHKSRHF